MIDTDEINLAPATEITIDGLLYASDDVLVFASRDGRVEFVDGALVFILDENQEQSFDSAPTSSGTEPFGCYSSSISKQIFQYSVVDR